MAIGALEPPFFALLAQALGLTCGQHDARLRDEIEAAFASAPRDHWCRLLEGSDACFAPVLSLADAPRHPHNVARGTFVTHDGLLQPAPAPRFSRLED